jgi:hypothetical protein
LDAETDRREARTVRRDAICQYGAAPHGNPNNLSQTGLVTAPLSINLTLKSNSYEKEREEALLRAVRSGALSRFELQLERGEHDVRRLWLRPNVVSQLARESVGEDQFFRVQAALRRFVVGGLFNVVSNACESSGVPDLADIRELKTDPPPFVEMRFKPPKHQLRLFGRFVCKDGLILTSLAMKSPLGTKCGKSLSVPAELKRCNEFFRGQGFDLNWVPATIETSITNAKIN